MTARIIQLFPKVFRPVEWRQGQRAMFGEAKVWIYELGTEQATVIGETRFGPQIALVNIADLRPLHEGVGDKPCDSGDAA